jgi:hypothetical protein
MLCAVSWGIVDFELTSSFDMPGNSAETRNAFSSSTTSTVARNRVLD